MAGSTVAEWTVATNRLIYRADLAASAAAEARGDFAGWAAECPHLRLLAYLLPPREGW